MPDPLEDLLQSDTEEIEDESIFHNNNLAHSFPVKDNVLDLGDHPPKRMVNLQDIGAKYFASKITEKSSELNYTNTGMTSRDQQSDQEFSLLESDADASYINHL